MKMEIPKNLEDKRLAQIGKHIRYLRKTKTNLSAENFAYEKGFDRVQYSRIEKGTNITMKTLLKVVDSHNMTLKDFFNFMD
jgi:hypothetical protein